MPKVMAGKMHAAAVRQGILQAKSPIILFYVGFFILCLANVISDIAFEKTIRLLWESMRDILGIIAVYCFIFKFAFQSWDLKSLVIAGITLLLGLLIRLNTGDSTFFFLCLMASCIDGIRLKTLAKVLIASIILAILVCAICSFLFVTVNCDIYDSRAFFNCRFALGFTHPNALGKLLMAFSASLVIVSERRSVLGAFVLLATLAVTFFLADSRTGSIAIVGILAIYCSKESHGLLRINWGRITLLLICFAFLFTLYIMHAYNEADSKMTSLSVLLSYRLEFWHLFYSHYGLTPLGNTLVSGSVLNMHGTDAQLDGAYAVALIQYGFIAALFISGLLIAFVCDAKRNPECNRLLAVLAILLAAGLTESYAFSPVYNIVIVGIGCYIRSVPVESFLGIAVKQKGMPGIQIYSKDTL